MLIFKGGKHFGKPLRRPPLGGAVARARCGPEERHAFKALLFNKTPGPAGLVRRDMESWYYPRRKAAAEPFNDVQIVIDLVFLFDLFRNRNGLCQQA